MILLKSCSICIAFQYFSVSINFIDTNSLCFQLDFKMDGRTIFHLACHEGYLDLVKFLLREGADVKDQDDEGDTPLHYAAFGYAQ